ncbi:AAA family ATPase [candidate division WOR-3 bacterium]|nr:AAA family ATPase [candidate division WOR-3 bacterium]
MSQTSPSVLSMLKGQPQAVDFLERVLEDPQGGYIFFGPDGVGKRTAAILFAAAVNPPSFSQGIFNFSNPDILPLFPIKSPADVSPDKWMEAWVEERVKYVLHAISPDPQPTCVIPIGLDEKTLNGTIRDLRREMKFPPRILSRRVALLFDFDRIKPDGANAFLKTLEEPQAQTILVLTTSRPFTLPPTIRSRCKIVRFNALPDEVICEYLINQGHDDEEALMAADLAFGSLKQALHYLEDKDNFIAEPVLAYLEKPSTSSLPVINFIESLGWKPKLDKITFSFGLVFHWVVRTRAGRLPRWKRLAGLVKSLAGSISRASLAHNIMLTERMSGRVALNPTANLFLYQYLTSLKFS